MINNLKLNCHHLVKKGKSMFSILKVINMRAEDVKLDFDLVIIYLNIFNLDKVCVTKQFSKMN